jgi:fructokinase
MNISDVDTAIIIICLANLRGDNSLKALSRGKISASPIPGCSQAFFIEDLGMKKPYVVVGIGELLWDVFPEGKRLGGAPVNFSYHCHQLGATAYPVSAVGADTLGTEIRDVLGAKRVPDGFVALDETHPTGTVQVTLDENGKPEYEICEGVAWDYIPLSGKLEVLAEKTDAVCFGSLAQRNEVSRATIHTFLGSMWPDALKIFDVNLRQSFFSMEIIESSLAHSTVLKLSDEELPVLAEMFGLTGQITEQLEALRAKFDLRLIAYTRGPGGSLLVSAGEIHDHSGYPVSVIDSVGAGDSFTAALCMGLLNNKQLSDINEHANRVGSFVCQQTGATPVLPDELIRR